MAGVGTSGTVMGLSRFFQETSPEVRVVAVEPVLGHKIQGLKNMQEAIVPAIYNPLAYHRKMIVEDDDAFETARLLATHQGIFCGMSGGAAVAAALTLSQELASGMIVVIIPDRGDRYLSTNLFKSMCAQCPP